jgi:GNAT superfamily N-acetyltransferase
MENRFHIRPIKRDDLDFVADSCWENRETQIRLLKIQEILGLGAWEESKCVGQLHCYSVQLPNWDDSNFPGYGRAHPLGWPLGFPLMATKRIGLIFNKPVWAHACFHVGFTPGARHADSSYFGKGIGTALCQASIEWARSHGYAAILAHGGTKAAPAYNTWMGCLPWTAYARLGFESIAQEEDGKQLPWWAKEAPPNVMQQVNDAISSGKRLDELCARVMLLRF